jgi:integrase
MAPVKRHESPVKRVNPSGKTAWAARYTNAAGKRVSAGTFKTKRAAQAAIDAAYEEEDRAKQAPRGRETFGDYAATWTTRRPRARRTNISSDGRINAVLDVEVDGVPLRDWPFADLKRRHALDLVDHMLRTQGRARIGAINILRTLSSMAEDAITDGITDAANPFRGVKIRVNDPRLLKESRPVRVFTWDQMHAFADAAGAPARKAGGAVRSQEPRRSGGAAYDPVAVAIVRTFADTGMRIQDVLPLRRSDLDRREMVFHARRTVSLGEIQEGTKRDHLLNTANPSGRVAPCPPSLLALIDAIPPRIDTELLYPAPQGRLWNMRNFYRDLWYPTQRAAGLDIRPHEMRHSFLTLLVAAGVDLADLSQMAGHDLETLVSHYTHPLNRSLDKVRAIIG